MQSNKGWIQTLATIFLDSKGNIEVAMPVDSVMTASCAHDVMDAIRPYADAIRSTI